MIINSIFENLFILDIANNHNGDFDHALKIVNIYSDLIKKHRVNGCIKFQYRNLSSFIHPDHLLNNDNKNIRRFLNTKLNWDQFNTLIHTARSNGVKTMVTPFDEESVDILNGHKPDFVKVASCSLLDWPLLEKIADLNYPVVVSTGGSSLSDIDKVVSFFEHRKVDFAIMHCVSIYPTPLDHLELNQISLLKNRYPTRPIGFSTHEDPDELLPIAIAYAKGAQLFERHIGIEDGNHQLNKYSSNQSQIESWFSSFKCAVKACGSTKRKEPHLDEIRAIQALSRGVFALNPIKAGQLIDRGDVFFAMPAKSGQLLSGQFRSGIEAITDIPKLKELDSSSVKPHTVNPNTILQQSIHSVKAMINEAKINLPSAFETEFSHHYGIHNFPKTGATLITIVNRIYCKKIIIMLPGQHHPSHYHKSKEETFFVLSGVLEMIIEGKKRTLVPGDSVLVQQGVWHEFWSDSGAIFDEISSTDIPNDSFYSDKNINAMQKNSRKTRVNQWGRYQLGKISSDENN